MIQDKSDTNSSAQARKQSQILPFTESSNTQSHKLSLNLGGVDSQQLIQESQLKTDLKLATENPLQLQHNLKVSSTPFLFKNLEPPQTPPKYSSFIKRPNQDNNNNNNLNKGNSDMLNTPQQNLELINNNSQISNIQDTFNSSSNPYNLSRLRFFQIGVYVISDLANSICIYSFQTIASQVSKILNIDPFVVSLNLSFYSFLYPFISILGNYMIDQKGACFSIRVGLILTVVGCCLRLLVLQSWGYVLLSCVLCGAGGPLIFNAKCRFQSNWFRPNDLPQITTISTVLTSLNGTIGVLLPGFYFTGYDYQTDTSIDYKAGKDKLFNLLTIEAIVVVTAAVVSFVLIREKPTLPSSFISTMKRENFKESFKGMLKNKAYLKLNLAVMLLIGNTSALAALFSFAIEPFGFNQTDTTYCAAGMILFGVIGSAINAPILRKYKKFRLTIVTQTLIMLASVIVIAGVINLNSIYLLVLFVAFFGGGYQPLISTSYEYACEIVFPIGEGSAQGFLMGSSSIFGFVCITVFGAIVKGENKMQTYIMFIFLFLFILIGMLLIYFSNSNLNRLNMELSALKHNPGINKQEGCSGSSSNGSCKSHNVPSNTVFATNTAIVTNESPQKKNDHMRENDLLMGRDNNNVDSNNKRVPTKGENEDQDSDSDQNKQGNVSQDPLENKTEK